MAKFKLTAFLIKEDYEDFDSVIRDESFESEHDLNGDIPLEGKIFTGRNHANSPEWLDLLRTGTLDEIPNLINSSTRAVLLIRSHHRIFAFPFGFGRYMIEEESIVRDFGIKVVLNSVNPSKLRSIDTTTFDELTIHARTQTSRSTNVSSFGIDIVRDLLKAVTGQPNNENFGAVITGRDAVQFAYELDEFSNFEQICNYLHERYNSNEYQSSFDWFDNLQMVSDPTLQSILNGKLLEAISTRDENRLHIAPPEVIDWMNIGGFTYTPNGDIKSDLLVSDYFGYLNQRDLEFDTLKRQHINVWNNDRTEIGQKWRLYNCIVFETEHNEDVYILTVGNWFRIDTSFANTVKDYVQAIPNADIDLPLCRHGEYEGIYNDRVSIERDNIITLDRKTITVEGNQIEICDLLTQRGQFIHVKPWKSSSTLSHLFSQGRVSAVTLLQDIGFRRDVRTAIEEIDPTFVDVVNEASINPNDVEVVFAIIDSDHRDLHERLPFFSKLNMMHTVRLLRNLRFKVSKLHIRREP